jgi:hypothetical protein
MILYGHFQNGVVILDGGMPLPDGTAVVIQQQSAKPALLDEPFAPIPFPLIQSGEPGSLKLTNQLIAEIFDEEDAASAGY